MAETIRAGQSLLVDGVELLVLSRADYERLLVAAESDDMLVNCQTCGAWLDRDEAANAADFTGCWFAATYREKDRATCRREQRAFPK